MSAEHPPGLTDSDHSSDFETSDEDNSSEFHSDSMEEEVDVDDVPAGQQPAGGTSDYGSRSGSDQDSRSQGSENSQPPDLEEILTLKSSADLRKEGNDYFKDGQYEEAIKSYEEAIKVETSVTDNRSHEEVAKCYSNIAHCYNQKKLYNEALQSAFKAMEAKPDFFRSYVRASLSLENLGKTKLSVMALMMASAYNPSDKDTEEKISKTDKIIIVMCHTHLKSVNKSIKEVDLNNLFHVGFPDKKPVVPPLPSLIPSSNDEESSPSSDENGGCPKDNGDNYGGHPKKNKDKTIKKKGLKSSKRPGHSRNRKGAGDSSSEDEGSVPDLEAGRNKRQIKLKSDLIRAQKEAEEARKIELEKKEEEESTRRLLQEVIPQVQKSIHGLSPQLQKPVQDTISMVGKSLGTEFTLSAGEPGMHNKVSHEDHVWSDYLVLIRMASDCYIKGIMTQSMEKFGESLQTISRDFKKLKYKKKNVKNCEEVVVIKYMFARASTECGSYKDILSGHGRLVEIQTVHAEVRFPAVHYGFALLYKKLHRFEQALQCVESGLKYFDKKLPAITFNYPGQDTEPLPETIPTCLQSRLSDLRLDLRCPPKPDAVCKYVDCLKSQEMSRAHLEISASDNIYINDPDYRGHVKVWCRQDCGLDYHDYCWGLIKSEHKQKMGMTKNPSEKDFFGDICFTPDCEGVIIKIQIFEVNSIEPKNLEDKKLIDKLDNEEKIKRKEEKERKLKINNKLENKTKKKKKEHSKSVSEKESSPESVAEDNIIDKPQVTVPTNLPSVESYAKQSTPPADIPMDQITVLKKQKNPGDDDNRIEKKKPKKAKEKNTMSWDELKQSDSSNGTNLTNDHEARLEKLAFIRDNSYNNFNTNTVPPNDYPKLVSKSTFDDLTRNKNVHLAPPNNYSRLASKPTLEDHIDGYLKSYSPREDDIAPEIVNESLKTFILQRIIDTLVTLGPLRETDKRLLEQFDHQAKKIILDNKGLVSMSKFDERIGNYSDVLFVKGVHDPQRAKEIKEIIELIPSDVEQKKLFNSNLGAMAKKMREEIETTKNTNPGLTDDSKGFSSSSFGLEKAASGKSILEEIKQNAQSSKTIFTPIKDIATVSKRDRCVQTDISDIDLDEQDDPLILREANDALIGEVQEAKDKLSKMQNERKMEVKDLNDKVKVLEDDKKSLRTEHSKLLEQNVKMQKSFREAQRKEEELKVFRDKLENEKAKSEALNSDLKVSRNKLHAEGRLTYELKTQMEAGKDEVKLLRSKCLKIELDGSLKLLALKKKENADLLNSLTNLHSTDPAVRSSLESINEHSALLFRKEDELKSRYEARALAGNITELNFDWTEVDSGPDLSSSELDYVRLVSGDMNQLSKASPTGTTREHVAPFSRPQKSNSPGPSVSRPPNSSSPGPSVNRPPPGLLGPPPGLGHPPSSPGARRNPTPISRPSSGREGTTSSSVTGSGRIGSSKSSAGSTAGSGRSGADIGADKAGNPSKMKSSHVKLIEALRMRYSDLTVEGANRYITKLRAENGGRLSGMPQSTIYEKVGKFLSEDRPRSQDPEECSICLERLASEPSRPMNPCGHIFHNSCIDTWFLSARGAGNTCPNCRNYIVQEEEFPDLGQQRRGPRT